VQPGAVRHRAVVSTLGVTMFENQYRLWYLKCRHKNAEISVWFGIYYY